VFARAQMFGVIRREALEETRRLPNFAGGDHAMLAELALLGRFAYVPERLFVKCFHADASKGVERLSERRWELLLGSAAAGILLRARRQGDRGHEQIDIRAPRLCALPEGRGTIRGPQRSVECGPGRRAAPPNGTANVEDRPPHRVPRLGAGDGPTLSGRFHESCPGARATEGH
jgi:hypothetical protein